MRATLAIASLAMTLSMPAAAGEADVIDARVARAADGLYNFHVTVRSNDTGWDYYADAFEILGPDGSVLGRRVLLHPHENEQFFTRELYGVAIPEGVSEVTVRAHHKPQGYEGHTLTVPLPR